ncbi:hypothetical protein NK6_8741 [Bradyrhizobium diazoefficiens]|uniref:Uncharacterized protein n=1 Tax=Bradyrhizobium diazoefficiens TaxID=1355477 RepID=A0A0E4BWQ5_9BRAD|nr:hypothetical protein NK6_8741 [Bradyrhizobium diazoefficiens]
MIPAVITDTSIMFFAKGRAWTLAEDHPKFHDVKAILASGSDDIDTVVQMTDVRVAVEAATAGRAVLTDKTLTLDGQELSVAWRKKAVSQPDSLKVLIVNTGDKVRVQGDDDAPDGIYIVGDLDDTDINKRVMVEDEQGEGYFGYVANTSIKEIMRDAA